MVSRWWKVVAWAAYDFGNSAYLVLVLSVFYGLYFTDVVLEGRPGGKLAWGAMVGASTAFMALLAPTIGALADARGSRMWLLALLTGVSCLGTAGLSLVGPGDVLAGVVIFVVANTAYYAAVGLYDSLLPTLVPPALYGRASGIGMAGGYLGTLVVIWLALPVAEQRPHDIRPVFVLTAIFFATAALPLLLGVREGRPGSAGSASLRAIVGRLRARPGLLRFLVGFALLTNGFAAMHLFIAQLAREMGFTSLDVLRFFVIAMVPSVVSAVTVGWLADRIGYRATVGITVAAWMLLIGSLPMVRTPEQFSMLAVLAGMVVPAAVAVGRAWMGRLAREENQAEAFGLFALGERGTGLIGPALFGRVADAFGSLSGLWVVAGLILAGWLVVRKAPEGISAAVPGDRV